MASIKDKVQTGLDEARTLILGAQVLLGFQYESVFQKTFEELPKIAQYSKGLGLALMVITLMLLIAPASFHRLVERGEDTPRQHHFTSTMMKLALFPFAIGLGLDLFVVVTRVADVVAGVIAGAATVLVALFFWYGLEMYSRAKRGAPAKEDGMKEERSEDEKTELKDKVRHVLTETRVVLPGAQALLGFQFIAMLTEQFEKLPPHSRWVHLASLVVIALATILLITPASYHRIVNHGENTEEFHRFAGRMVVIAMIPIALGICGDVYVVFAKIFDSEPIAIAAAAILLLGFAGLWFLLPLAIRRKREGRALGAVKYER